MTDRPLQKPEHLVGVTGPGSWLAQRPWGAGALALGILAFLVCAITQGGVTSLPDARVSLPAFALVVIASGLSLVRREPGAYPLLLLGLALAGAAIVLGWFLMIVVVIGAAAVLIVILHAVL